MTGSDFNNNDQPVNLNQNEIIVDINAENNVTPAQAENPAVVSSIDGVALESQVVAETSLQGEDITSSVQGVREKFVRKFNVQSKALDDSTIGHLLGVSVLEYPVSPIREVVQQALNHYIDLLERQTTLGELYGFASTRILWNKVEQCQQDNVEKRLEEYHQRGDRDALISFVYKRLDAHEVLTWFAHIHAAKKLEGTDTPWRVFGQYKSRV